MNNMSAYNAKRRSSVFIHVQKSTQCALMGGGWGTIQPESLVLLAERRHTRTAWPCLLLLRSHQAVNQ